MAKQIQYTESEECYGFLSRCSDCHEVFDGNSRYRFCPLCAASLDAEIVRPPRLHLEPSWFPRAKALGINTDNIWSKSTLVLKYWIEWGHDKELISSVDSPTTCRKQAVLSYRNAKSTMFKGMRIRLAAFYCEPYVYSKKSTDIPAFVVRDEVLVTDEILTKK